VIGQFEAPGGQYGMLCIRLDVIYSSFFLDGTCKRLYCVGSFPKAPKYVLEKHRRSANFGRNMAESYQFHNIVVGGDAHGVDLLDPEYFDSCAKFSLLADAFFDKMAAARASA
jgi:hypothetical protein